MLSIIILKKIYNIYDYFFNDKTTNRTALTRGFQWTYYPIYHHLYYQFSLITIIQTAASQPFGLTRLFVENSNDTATKMTVILARLICIIIIISGSLVSLRSPHLILSLIVSGEFHVLSDRRGSHDKVGWYYIIHYT